MPRFQKIPWPRIFAEGTAIIVSILLAFWIQAWWEGLQRQGDERIFLQSLLDDLNHKKDWFESKKQYSQTIFDSATELLQAATDADKELAAGTIDEQIGNIVWYHQGADWDSAPMSALAMGGDSVNISNTILLRELVALQNSLSIIRDNYDADKRFHYDTLAPFLINNSNLAQIYAAIEHAPGDPGAIFEFPKIKVSAAHDTAALLSRDDFQGLLVIKIDLLLDIFRTIQTQHLEEQLNTVTAMLEDELAG
jgi:hypothetical protein